MKPLHIFFAIAVTLTICACKPRSEQTTESPKVNEKKRAFPKVVDISTLSRTTFASTLESPIVENKNVIYTPTLLFAWDTIKQVLKQPVTLNNNNSQEFTLLNQSATHINSLNRSEYSLEVSVSGGIVARAYFNKSLPFDIKFQRLNDVVPFEGDVVDAFGMQEYDADIAMQAEILYYFDDDHFVLKLKPKDTQHEMLLVKGLKRINTLSDAVKQANDLIARGKVEMGQTKLQWKYVFNTDDKFTIPVLSLNIESRLPELTGQSFMAGNKQHVIDSAFQRNALILDEFGAEVESEAVLSTDTASFGPPPVIENPKNLILNKTFYVIIRHVDQTNPYFVMKVANSELMTKSY